MVPLLIKKKVVTVSKCIWAIHINGVVTKPLVDVFDCIEG